MTTIKKIVKNNIIEFKTLCFVHSKTQHVFKNIWKCLFLVLVSNDNNLVASELRLRRVMSGGHMHLKFIGAKEDFLHGMVWHRHQYQWFHSCCVAGFLFETVNTKRKQSFQQSNNRICKLQNLTMRSVVSCELNYLCAKVFKQRT